MRIFLPIFITALIFNTSTIWASQPIEDQKPRPTNLIENQTSEPLLIDNQGPQPTEMIERVIEGQIPQTAALCGMHVLPLDIFNLILRHAYKPFAQLLSLDEYASTHTGYRSVVAPGFQLIHRILMPGAGGGYTTPNGQPVNLAEAIQVIKSKQTLLALNPNILNEGHPAQIYIGNSLPALEQCYNDYKAYEAIVLKSTQDFLRLRLVCKHWKYQIDRYKANAAIRSALLKHAGSLTKL
jgi:hypothetical protein